MSPGALRYVAEGIDTVPGWFWKLDARLLVLIQEAQRSCGIRGDMLEVGLAAGDQGKFLDVYRDSGDDPAGLWAGLEQAGFGDEKVAMLRATSALGRMTLQNAPGRSQ